MKNKKADFYNTTDFSQKTIHKLIDLALDFKRGKVKKRLPGKVLLMIFFNRSLRTRTSFIVSMYKLGGHAIDVSMTEGKVYPLEFRNKIIMNKDKPEHIKEAARVISRYCDILAIRSNNLAVPSAKEIKVFPWKKLKKDVVVKSFMKYATVPVISMESNVYHPCQGLADAMTIKEKLKKPQGKKYVLTWAYHPRPAPMAVPNSQMLIAADLGMRVTVVHPKGWELDPEIVRVAKKRAKQSGGSLKITYEQRKAFKGADIVCAKSWGALKFYDQLDKEAKIRDNLKHWIVDTEKMKLTNNAYFMHCLPLRRNVIVTDEVLDSPRSVVIDEAANRLWVNMALLITLLKK